MPEFLESFAHDCIDEGADAFVGNGPHVLRGIKIYEGVPIFYSFGNFFMQNETVTQLPAETYERYDLDPSASLPADLFDERIRDGDGDRIEFLGERSFWESVLPICGYSDGQSDTVRLYPLDLGYEEPRPRWGWPVLADGDTAERIVKSLRELSEPYGTTIENDGDSAETDVDAS